MAKNFKGSLIGGFDLLRVPDAPTISSITENSTELVVVFTDPLDVGGAAISSYTALALEGSNLTTASSSTARSMLPSPFTYQFHSTHQTQQNYDLPIAT